MEIIFKYFPDLTSEQQKQLSLLKDVYAEWNEKINVVSRKDIENLYERHVLHSLAIAKFIEFESGSKIMDLGTGGGFPGVPLAIMFPESRFHLVDSIGKKLKVIDAAVETTGLKNVFTFHSRAEQMEYQYDFVVSRAVAPATDLMSWSRGKYFPKNRHKIVNGLICLKGGDLTEELKPFPKGEVTPLSKYFSEEFFSDKSLVYIPRV
jgi:16S rRNA (guanine527-N7)-methyltransferase